MEYKHAAVWIFYKVVFDGYVFTLNFKVPVLFSIISRHVDTFVPTWQEF